MEALSALAAAGKALPSHGRYEQGCLPSGTGTQVRAAAFAEATTIKKIDKPIPCPGKDAPFALFCGALYV